MLVVDRDGQRRRLQAGAVAGRARHEPHVALVLLARVLAVAALVAPLDPRDDALVLGGVRAGAAVAVLVLDGHLAVDAVQDDLLLLGRELLPRGVHVDLVGLGDRLEHPREVLRVGAAPRGDRAVGDRHLDVGDQQLGVDLERRAEPVARDARAVRRVEREVARRRLVVARAAHGTGQVLAERQRLGGRFAFAGHDLDLGDAVGEAERRLERVGEAPLDPLLQHQPVDDDLDLVVLVLGEPLVALQELVDVDRLAVDAGPDVALTGQVLEQRVVLALAAAHDRSQHLEPQAVVHGEDAVDDLLRRLALQPGAVVRAVLDADAGVQQAQVVVDLGDRADGRAWVLARRLLVDRDRRRQALDHVDVGLVHLPEELAGVRTQRLDVAALALGVDRVEREARLARTRTAR